MLEDELERYFGFRTFKAGQKKVIETILKGESSAAIFPTGSGKSLCYQLSAMLLPGLTIVVSPLLSLMKDQLDFLDSKGLSAARLDSTLDRDDYNEILRQAVEGELKILMMSIERFKNERFRLKLKQMKISLLVVDEAHCISEWGHNFRPEYLKVPLFQKDFTINQILLLTATATPPVIKDMSQKLDIPLENFVTEGFYRPNLFLKVTGVIDKDKNNYLLRQLNQYGPCSIIIYVTLQKTAESVASFLIQNGLNCQAYHAGLPHDKRQEIQHHFMNGASSIIVATIAFGMGIDKPDIRHIIHYDLPKSLENYSQEIGRAGRDGEPSFCEVLANLDNVNTLENFAYGDTPDKEGIANVLQQIKDVPSETLELKFLTLSNQCNIRLIPLKTLFVYLELKGIVKPKYTYFSEYSFKYLIPREQISEQFGKERQSFLNQVFDHTTSGRVWEKIDISDVAASTNSSRERVLTALEYLDTKKWIELRATGTVEVYSIIDNTCDLTSLRDDLYTLFKQKEQSEIERIKKMIQFFESTECLSHRLSNYFGENILKTCGHCSPCDGDSVRLVLSRLLPDLQALDLLSDLKSVNELPFSFTTQDLTRFFCGITTPRSTKHKLKMLPGFGRLSRYPYDAVRQEVAALLK